LPVRTGKDAAPPVISEIFHVDGRELARSVVAILVAALGPTSVSWHLRSRRPPANRRSFAWHYGINVLMVGAIGMLLVIAFAATAYIWPGER
jgi:hypothetical protein